MSDSRHAVRLSPLHLMVPVIIVVLTLVLQYGYQMSIVVTDRDRLFEMRGRQDAAFADSQRVQAQFGALVLGTQKLAEKGNKNALPLYDKLKQIGIIGAPPAGTPEASTAPVPAATEPVRPSADKP